MSDVGATFPPREPPWLHHWCHSDTAPLFAHFYPCLFPSLTFESYFRYVLYHWFWPHFFVLFFHFFSFCLRFGFKIVGLNGRKSEKGQRTDLEVRRRILGRKRPKILSFTPAAEPRGPKLEFNIRPRQSRPRKLAPVWTCHLGTAPPAAPPPSAPRQDLLRGRPRVPRHAQTPGPEPCPSFKTPSTRDGKIRGSTGDHSSIHRPVFVVLLYSLVVNFY